MSASHMTILSKTRFNELILTLISLHFGFFFSGGGRESVSFNNSSESHSDVKSHEIILELTRSK